MFFSTNQHIRMISEGSCDTEIGVILLKFSFGTTGINYIIIIYSNRKVILICNNVSQYYCIFDQINTALVSKRDFFHNIKKKNPIDPKLLNIVYFILRSVLSNLNFGRQHLWRLLLFAKIVHLLSFSFSSRCFFSLHPGCGPPWWPSFPSPASLVVHANNLWCSYPHPLLPLRRPPPPPASSSSSPSSNSSPPSPTRLLLLFLPLLARPFLQLFFQAGNLLLKLPKQGILGVLVDAGLVLDVFGAICIA